MPRISVIVATYNRQERLSRCLDALLAQTFRDSEVIVVDDGSDPPVQSSNVIPGDVVAIFRELHARTLVRALVVPRNVAHHRETRLEELPRQARQHRRIQKPAIRGLIHASLLPGSFPAGGR